MQAQASQYAQSIKDAQSLFLETTSFGCPEADTARFLPQNNSSTQKATSSFSSFKTAATSFSNALEQAASAFAAQDASLAQDIG